MRFQLALNVKNLDESIAYYSKLFGVEVNKRKPGYANFAVDNPPLKLVLFENPNAADRLNHVGFEVDTAAEVEETIDRIEPLGLASEIIGVCKSLIAIPVEVAFANDKWGVAVRKRHPCEKSKRTCAAQS